jgi:hypothetical protein
MGIRGAVLLLAGWLCTGQPAAAWEYQAGGFAAWQQVSERDDGATLVDEQGLVGGFDGSALVTPGAWRLGVNGGVWAGMLDYDGATQLGAPLSTETEWTGWHLGGVVERRFIGPMPMRLGGGLEYQWRQRSIGSVGTISGLEERYRTLWLGIGGELQPMASTALNLEAACAVSSDVEVRFDATFDDADVSLGDHCRAGVSVSVDVARVGGKTVFVRPFADWERYPRSEAIRLTAGGSGVGTLYLPETELTSFGITIGIRGSRE